MLDNLRNQASFTPEEEPVEEAPKKPAPRKPRKTLDQLTGMTAPQRFVLAVMLLFMVCLLGMVILLATEKVIPPGGL